MHFLIKASIPAEVGNAKQKDGTLGDTTNAILAQAKPEIVFFTGEGGVRTIYTLVNVADSSDITLIQEAWYIGLDASVEVQLACTPEDMAKSAPQLPGIVAKFA